MKTIKMIGADIKADNGSGYNLAGAFPQSKVIGEDREILKEEEA